MAGTFLRNNAGVVTTILVLLATVAAALLRLPHLASESIWTDEAVSIAQASEAFGAMIGATAADNYPPLHNIVLFASLRLFGYDELGARIPSVLFGVMTIPVMYALGREFYGRGTGILAAALLAVALFHIRLSQEARMYSIFAFFAALSLLAFLRYLRHPSWRVAILYAAATVAMLYTQFYALFALAVENLVFLTLLLRHAPKNSGGHFLRWVGIQAGIVALFLPWVPFLLTRTAAIQGAFWIPRPTVGQTINYFLVFGGGRAGTAIGVLLSAAAVTAALVPSRKTGPPPTVGELWPSPGEKLLLLALWMLLPIAVASALSFVLQPFLYERYLIAASLTWYILVAAGVVAVRRISPTLAVVCGLVLLGLNARVFVINFDTPQKPDLRSATAYFNPRLLPGDIILADPYRDRWPLRYYAPDKPLTIIPYPVNDVTAASGRRWIVSEEKNDECWSGQPGPVSSVRPLIERRTFSGVAVCLYGDE